MPTRPGAREALLGASTRWSKDALTLRSFAALSGTDGFPLDLSDSTFWRPPVLGAPWAVASYLSQSNFETCLVCERASRHVNAGLLMTNVPLSMQIFTSALRATSYRGCCGYKGGGRFSPPVPKVKSAKCAKSPKLDSGLKASALCECAKTIAVRIRAFRIDLL
jgi:hypothetical protein